MTKTPEQAVIQADRDCAENAIRAWVLMGANDDAWPDILAQAFATYRLDVTNPADCGCGMGVLCFRDRREPALDKIAFAIIEGSAGLRAAEHAKEFQTGNWRDALRSAQAVTRLAHSQPASEGLREALEIACNALDAISSQAQHLEPSPVAQLIRQTARAKVDEARRYITPLQQNDEPKPWAGPEFTEDFEI